MTFHRSAISAVLAAAIQRNLSGGFIGETLAGYAKSPRKRKPSGKDRTKVKAARQQRVRSKKK